jgi:transcriptional regulator with XRE-family HTH domain
MNRIKVLRLEKNLTLKQLSEITGIPDGSISRYETGKREPRDKETWKKIAHALGLQDLDVGYLMGVQDFKVSDYKWKEKTPSQQREEIENEMVQTELMEMVNKLIAQYKDNQLIDEDIFEITQLVSDYIELDENRRVRVQNYIEDQLQLQDNE